MDFIISVLYMMGQVFLDILISPAFIILYLLIFLLVGWQYKRMETSSRSIVQSKKRTYIKSTLTSIMFGLIGGLVGSILLVFTGIDLHSIGIGYLWLIAIVLMLINPRYLCFAYAGGILAGLNLIFAYPQVNIPQLMGLVAILHMVESILILLNGPLFALPIYVKKNNAIRGGFNLQKFWPLPLIALVGVGIAEPASGITMPDWWPLFQDYSQSAENKIYTLLPVLAILGYGEITTTSSPVDRCRKTAFYLFLYSLTLLVLSVFSAKWAIFLPAAALFSPLGHELVIWLGIQEEKAKPSLYTRPLEGVGVLAIEPNTMASRIGIEAGDNIIRLNDKAITCNANLIDLVNHEGRLEFTVKRNNANISIRGRKGMGEELGLILVPDNEVKRYLTFKKPRRKNRP
ncbi:MAG TPA: PDZ domain-containing protein [Syntrophomonadaceae bacterium]|nr:PDZ domain-containing protein [Syntrophomonadaceae bacterium]